MISNELLKSFDWIKAVYKVGSQTLPYIDNYHDLDYTIIVEHFPSHSQLCDFYKYKPSCECWFCTERADLWKSSRSYSCHYAQLIYGEPKGEIYEMFDHINEYKADLIKDAYGVSYEESKNFKFWYHILTGIYMLQNGKYELTDEQIANVRLCHDKQMTREIYDYIQGMLLEYKVQLGL